MFKKRGINNNIIIADDTKVSSCIVDDIVDDIDYDTVDVDTQTKINYNDVSHINCNGALISYIREFAISGGNKVILVNNRNTVSVIYKTLSMYKCIYLEQSIFEDSKSKHNMISRINRRLDTNSVVLVATCKFISCNKNNNCIKNILDNSKILVGGCFDKPTHYIAEPTDYIDELSRLYNITVAHNYCIYGFDCEEYNNSNRIDVNVTKRVIETKAINKNGDTKTCNANSLMYLRRYLETTDATDVDVYYGSVSGSAQIAMDLGATDSEFIVGSGISNDTLKELVKESINKRSSKCKIRFTNGVSYNNNECRSTNKAIVYSNSCVTNTMVTTVDLFTLANSYKYNNIDLYGKIYSVKDYAKCLMKDIVKIELMIEHNVIPASKYELSVYNAITKVNPISSKVEVIESYKNLINNVMENGKDAVVNVTTVSEKKCYDKFDVKKHQSLYFIKLYDAMANDLLMRSSEGTDCIFLTKDNITFDCLDCYLVAFYVNNVLPQYIGMLKRSKNYTTDRDAFVNRIENLSFEKRNIRNELMRVSVSLGFDPTNCSAFPCNIDNNSRSFVYKYLYVGKGDECVENRLFDSFNDAIDVIGSITGYSKNTIRNATKRVKLFVENDGTYDLECMAKLREHVEFRTGCILKDK